MSGGGLKAMLELSRISNLPTVWSNVVHGMSAGLFVVYVLPVEAMYGQRPTAVWGDLGRLLDSGFMLLLGLSLIYCGGMWMNDAVDAEVDTRERGTDVSGTRARPIPAGRISRRRAAVGAGVLLAGGWACTLVYREAVWVGAGALVGAVVLYNLVHRWRWTGWLLLPGCRATAVALGAVAVISGRAGGAGGGDAWREVLTGRAAWGVAAVAGYTLVVTALAWGEALPGRERWIRWIGWMIAMMPVVDAGYTLAYGLWPMAVFCLGCAAMASAGQRWVSGS